MRKFRFELEAVLEARRAEERRRRGAVAQIERERFALEDRIRAQQARIAAGREEQRRGLVGTLDAPALRRSATDSLHAMREAQRLVLELSAVLARLEAARTELTAASRDRRAVEKLRETRRAAWRRDVERAETIELDDIAGNGRSRS